MSRLVYRRTLADKIVDAIDLACDVMGIALCFTALGLMGFLSYTLIAIGAGAW